MTRKRKSLSRIILIVCEGAATEPNYFNWIAENISYPKEIWSKVEVSHNNLLPADISLPKATELGGKRKKKSFINPNKKKEKDVNLLKELFLEIYGQKEGVEKYEEIQAVPLRYVAQARCLEEVSGTYDEIWAVFDRDGHTYHKEAFELAENEINGKKVNIGFSSRSFEQWILLHFEKSVNPFEKTECKNEKGKPLNCNKHIGCQGNKCLVGYIRKHFLPTYAKSNECEDLAKIMSILMKNKDKAFENAAWLKAEMKPNLAQNQGKIYEINPYTNLDILLKRLTEI